MKISQIDDRVNDRIFALVRSRFLPLVSYVWHRVDNPVFHRIGRGVYTRIEFNVESCINR